MERDSANPFVLGAQKRKYGAGIKEADGLRIPTKDYASRKCQSEALLETAPNTFP